MGLLTFNTITCLIQTFFVKKIQTQSWYINPNSDPIRDALLVYEKILDDYFDKKNTEINYCNRLNPSTI